MAPGYSARGDGHDHCIAAEGDEHDLADVPLSIPLARATVDDPTIPMLQTSAAGSFNKSRPMVAVLPIVIPSAIISLLAFETTE